MIDDSSNTALEATTLSSNYYRWLASSAWTNEEIIFFSKQLEHEARGVFRGPPFFKKPQTPHLHIGGRWTLNRANAEMELLGWAELQQIDSHFNRGLLLTRIEPEVLADEALALCLGACLILGEFDQLRLVCAASLSDEVLSWGEKKTLHTPTVDPAFRKEGKPNLTSIDVIDIVPREWWLTKLGEKTQRELNYLRLRLKRAKKDSNCRCDDR